MSRIPYYLGNMILALNQRQGLYFVFATRATYVAHCIIQVCRDGRGLGVCACVCFGRGSCNGVKKVVATKDACTEDLIENLYAIPRNK
jgi:hypothetical protein